MSNFISNLKKLVLDKYARNSFLSYYFKSFKLTGVHAVITKEWAILKGPRESLIPDMVETTEKPILDLIKNLTLTGTCIDVGAWIGYYTLLLSRKARKIIAIEPDPRNQQYLNYNIQKNKIENIKVLPFALDTKDGTGKLVIAPNSTGNALYSPGYSTGFTVGVTTKKLATIISEVGESKIDLIKMDIEGREFSIIKSLDKDVFEKVDRWIIECHRKDSVLQRDLQKIFENNDYNVVWYRDSNQGLTDHIYSYKTNLEP